MIHRKPRAETEIAGADLFAVLGVEFAVPWIGTLLTGIFASRGSNYVNDLIGKIREKASGE